MQLTDHQQSELAKAVSGNVGLLTGNPGSGKTTTVASYIKQLQSQPGNRGIALAAPTGKAARRLTESLRGHGINKDAVTIHRLLGYTYFEGHGIFEHNRSNPLTHGHIFIDESSMVDASLISHLLAARRPESKIVFIGDPNQLPPVGHGAPLRDMIEMGLPHGHLSEIHRNAGRIVKCCKSIVEDQSFQSSKILSFGETCSKCGHHDLSPVDSIPSEPVVICNGCDHQFNPKETCENLLLDSDWKTPADQIQVISDWLDPTSQIFDIQGVGDPVWDVQVIVPLNEKGDLSRKSLNTKIQGWLNPDGRKADGLPFREDDKIVCGKNGWYLAAPGCPHFEVNDDGKVYCANGEQAEVVDVDGRHVVAKLTLPDRLVRITKPKKSDSDDTGKWELAYAISAHKSQGAEWKACIVIGDESSASKWVCDRHWLLTAISRASAACICVAKPNTIAGFCKRSNLWKRRTFAVEKFRELMRQ